MEDVFCVTHGYYNIFSSLRKPLREFIKEKTNSSGQSDQMVELILNCLRPSLRKILLAERNSSNKRAKIFDIVNSVENVLRRSLTEVIKLFCNEGLLKICSVINIHDKLVIYLFTYFININLLYILTINIIYLLLKL